MLRRQNSHSLFTAAAALFFAISLGLDLVLHRPGIEPWLLWVLLVCCLTLGATAVAMGRRFPAAAGMACVMVFIVATIYFIGPFGDAQSAVSSAQELPILALYLGWFVPRPLGRIVMLVAMTLLVVAVVANPLFHPDGALGVPSAVQLVIVALLCFEFGSMLWRRSELRSSTDQLTGALNRSGFMKRAERAAGRARRSGAPLSLAILDLDDFKALNDRFGHAAGDRALVTAVDSWRAELGASCTIGRVGGDEFAILFERCDIDEERQTMMRLRESAPHPWSWGAAQLAPNAEAGNAGDAGDAGDIGDAERLLAEADAVLYEAKRARVPR